MPPQIPPLLAPDEKILWSAQPRPYVFMLRGLPTLAYGITWAVLGAVWYRGSGGIGANSAFEGWWRLTPLFSLPFILAGLSFFLYPIRLGARARRTWYLVTNQRVLLIELPKKSAPKVRAFPPADLAAMHIRKRTGHLYDVTLAARARENPHLTPRLEDGFFGIENAGHALEALLPQTPAPSPSKSS